MFAKTIRGKIFLYTGLMFFFILGAVMAISGRDMYVRLVSDLKSDIALYCEKAALEIESANKVAVRYLNAIAISQETGLFGRREETVRFVRSVAENKFFYNCYIIYEPNADGQDAGCRNKAGCDDMGRFNAVVAPVNGQLDLITAVDMETSLYYQGLKEKFLSGSKEKFMITEPYVYEGVMMVEHTYPIVINGQFAGICGADRTLAYLSEYLAKMKPFKTADFILISRLGGIISATMDTKLNTKKIKDTPYHEILGAYHNNKEDRSVKQARDPIQGQDYFYVASSIKTGDWLLVMRVSRNEVLHPVERTLIRMAIVSAAGIAISFLILLWIVNSIARPIRASVVAAKRIASGDLTHHVEGGSEDGETGQLLGAIQAMTGGLSSLVGKVQQSCMLVTTSATEIAASARQLEATVTEQAASTNQVSTAADEISTTTRNLAETIHEVTEVASGAASLATSGRSGLQGMEARMQQLVNATGSIGSRLALISEKAMGISQIITAITKLADQTNLLSLNAAIEAEKAGELGLGFSVVAREIRRLADQTTVSTLGIERIVQEMQSAVSSGVMSMEKFSEDVHQGMREVKGIAAQMGEIIENVEALTPRFVAVNDGMQSQSQAAHQIGETMPHLNEAAHQTANSAREFNQAAEQLRDAVQSLRDEVSRFKVTG